MPADSLGAGSAPELLSLVFPGGSPVPGTAAPGAGVDGGANTCGVSGGGWEWGLSEGQSGVKVRLTTLPSHWVQ